MSATGRFLDKIHEQQQGAPRYFTRCGRRGYTTTDKAKVTCGTCKARIERDRVKGCGQLLMLSGN